MSQEKPIDRAKRLSSEGRCIICGVVSDGLKRGLCNAHYQTFRRERKSATKDEVQEWEAVLISRGELLPDGRQTVNPFRAALDLVRESRQKYDSADAGTVGGCDHVIKKAAPKCKINGGDKPIRKKGTT